MRVITIVRKPVEVEIDLRLITVLDRQVQETIITTYGSTSVNSDISRKHNLIHNPGTRLMGVWSPKRKISTEDAEDMMRAMTVTFYAFSKKTLKGRPAIVEELASYDGELPEEFGDKYVVALGEKFFVGSCKYAAFRCVAVSGRRLDLRNWTHDLNFDCHFLVVFEEEI